MNCKNCGAVISDTSSFCPSCGQTVKAESGSYAGSYQQPVSQPQPGYGGYSQTPRQPVYGQYQVGGQPVVGYPYPSAKQSSALKTFLILFMAAALILSITGLLSFPVIRQKIEKGSSISICTNHGNTLIYFIYSVGEEGFGDTMEEMFEDEALSSVCFFAMLAAMSAAVVFVIIGLICITAGNHSGGAATLGIGFIIANAGYIMNLIYAINTVSERNDGSRYNYYLISSAPIIMSVVCIGLAIMSFAAAGKLRNKN